MDVPVRGGEPESAFGGALTLPLDTLALGYRLGARVHRAMYEGRWIARRRLSCRVLSIGSLTVGGAGKTPLAAWVASGLRGRGHRAVLATRGYRRLRKDPVHALSDGRYVTGDVVGMGDEALILAAHAPGVPVLVGRDRGVVGLRAISAFGAEVLVLDDGFQHHRLARDLDIVTVDGVSGFGNRRVLPSGPLREPARALARAHALAVVDGPLAAADEEFLAGHAVHPYRLQARRRPVILRPIAGTVPGSRDPAPEPASRALAGARIGMLAGVGQPRSFRRTLEDLGATVIAEKLFRDHHRYRQRDFRSLAREAEVWVTTEKDALKILPRWVRHIDLRVLTIDLEVRDAEAVLDWIEAQLF